MLSRNFWIHCVSTAFLSGTAHSFSLTVQDTTSPSNAIPMLNLIAHCFSFTIRYVYQATPNFAITPNALENSTALFHCIMILITQHSSISPKLLDAKICSSMPLPSPSFI